MPKVSFVLSYAILTNSGTVSLARLITKIPPMVAKAAIDSGVAQEPIENWDKYEEELHSRLYSDKKASE